MVRIFNYPITRLPTYPIFLFYRIHCVAEKPSLQSFFVPPEASGQRLDQWLVSQLPEVSRVRVQQLIEQKKISVNGSLPKASLRLHGGEQIEITGVVELAP